MISEAEFTNFSPKRLFTVTKRVLKQIIRDRRTFGMILVMPMLIMLVFGISLSGEIKNVPIVIDNQDTGNFGNMLISSLDDDSRVVVGFNSFQNGVDQVENGHKNAVILIPQDFSQNIIAKGQGDETISITLFLHIDATKPIIRNNILGALQDAISEALGSQGIQLDETKAYGGAEFTGLDVAIPPVMGFVLTFLVLLLATLTLVRENIGGTQVRLYTTPLNKIERFLGYVLALTFFGLVEALAILVISIFAFGATNQGSMALLIFAAFFFALVHVLLSVVLSNFAENELQAIQMVPLIALPSMALSGMLVPIESLPDIAQTFSQIVPLTYGINIFEGIMLKGFGFTDLWLDFLKLAVFAAIFSVIALISVKDHDNSD